MTSDNRPCPFCGYHDVEIVEIDLGVYAVTCPECNAIGPRNYDSPYAALATWNQRVSAAELEAAGQQRLDF